MIRLDYRDARPIYEQVRDGLRHLVVSGAVAAGEPLPSVRSLAACLAINPNTIQRAYTALEQEGYLFIDPNKDVFAARSENPQNARRLALLQQFDGVVAELLFLGMKVSELAERLNRTACGKEDPT